jgi:MFS family permease
MFYQIQDQTVNLHDQTQILEGKERLLAFAVLSLASLVCFMDQNGIGVLLPSIAREFHAENSIACAGTVALIANTVFQVLYGRLSDIFGRKRILVSTLVLLALSDLGCALSKEAAMFYVFRALAGIANGGISSLSQMIVSDIVSLRNRGKYQGILGGMVGLGNAIGPIAASRFAIHSTWRGYYYLLAPLVLVVAVVTALCLPTNMPRVKLREAADKLDMLGLLTGSAAVVFLLLAVSQGGRAGWAWNSPKLVVTMCVGGAGFVTFIMVEWLWAELPVFPLRMFRIRSVAVMMAQIFLLGASYYSCLYFVPF